MSATLEERVAYLEGKVEEHTRAWHDLKEHIVHLEQSMNERFEAVDRRFETVDRRIDALREDMNKRFEAVDRRFEAVERRIDALDQKFSRYFLWTIGIQSTVLLAVSAALLR